MSTIKVYGADWCGMTTRTRRYLDNGGVPYEYINVDRDQDASRWVKEQNGGKEKKPTLDIDGAVLTAPSNAELEEVLRDHHLLDGVQATTSQPHQDAVPRPS